MSPDPGHSVNRGGDGPEPASWQQRAASQAGVISVRAALHGGLSRSEMRWGWASGRWQRPMRGVIVLNSGQLTYEQRLWCVVESIGPPVYLAGRTAVALAGLVGFADDRISVVVPAERRLGPRPGVALHRSTILGDQDVHPALRPPRTRVERSVIDSASWATSDEQARAVVAAAVQQRLTTPPMLRAALTRAGSRQRCALVAETLDDVEAGAHSTAEIAYRRLERTYGLPAGRLQVPVDDLGDRRRYLDVWYEPWGVWVEIDGSHHMEVRQWWDDLERQNHGVLLGRLLLRFPAHAVRTDPAKVAAVVAQALRGRGWPGPRSTSASSTNGDSVGVVGS